MKNPKIKCVIWDLDNTVWDGTLIEDVNVKLRPEVLNTIITLDERGILQSVSSKNDFDLAMKKLEEFQIADYFLYPQINWGAKSDAVALISKNLNISLDTFAFIDDQEFEREEVKFAHKEVLCIDALEVKDIVNKEEFIPAYITEDSKNRRLLYQNDIKRNKVEETFEGSKEAFLTTLNMKFRISKAVEEDLKRMEELTVRTHQLNSTGYIYSFDELNTFIQSPDYEVLVAHLADKYGEYGKIGLALIQKNNDIWYLKLLLMSCRVMSRGVGNVFLNYILNRARKEGVRLLSEFIQTERNRMMFITYKFNKFTEIKKENEVILLEADLTEEREIPGYITLDIDS